MPVSSYAYDYDINNYDINIKVSEDNIFYITEKIDVTFNKYKHGIYRKLPLKNEVLRNNKVISKNIATISNIEVNEEFTNYKKDGYEFIKIGSSFNTLRGDKSYEIKYMYDIGNDFSTEYDEFYFNLIGPEWDTYIDKVNFAIEMPSEFDNNNLHFYVGDKNKNIVNYIVNGNVIQGSLSGLYPGEAFTVDLLLPERYFELKESTDFLNSCLTIGSKRYLTIDIIAFCVPFGFLLIIILMWFKFGKDTKAVEVLEFYPPDNLNSAEIAYFYNGKISSKDITSLLVYLANKGYLVIDDIKKSIRKLREYDGTNEIEKMFMDGLFNSNGNEVSISSLKNSFYIVVNKIKKKMKKEYKKRVFDSSSLIAELISAFMITISIVVVIGRQYIFDIINLEPSLVFAIVMLVFMSVFIIFHIGTILFAVGAIVIGLVVGLFSDTKERSLGITVFMLFLIFMFVSILLPGIIGIIDIIKVISPYLDAWDSVVKLGCVAIIIMIIFAIVMDKRTKYGREILGRIKGFKNFLETAEKDRIESLVMDNPMYFYNILPYTYVLGVTNKWIEKFESIAYEPVNWYIGSSRINSYRMFGNCADSTITKTRSVMTSTPSSSRSGGSSFGGGRSGGGSGGGGGGSW